MTNGEKSKATASNQFLPAEEQAEYLGEWFRACTIERCGPAARRFLAMRGRNGFYRRVKDFGAEQVLSDLMRADYLVENSRNAEYDQTLNASDDYSRDEEDSIPDQDDQASDDESNPETQDSDEPDALETRSPVGRDAAWERPWQLLETHLVAPHGNEGKRYKDAILLACREHLNDPTALMKVFSGYLNLCFLTVVRQWVVAEGGHFRDSRGRPVARIQSTIKTEDGKYESILDHIGSEDETVSRKRGGPQKSKIHPDFLPDIVPDPSDPRGHEIATAVAEEMAGKVTDPMQVALAARFYGVGLDHPRVIAQAGREKSQLALYLQSEAKDVSPRSRSNLYAMINRAVRTHLGATIEDRALRALRLLVLKELMAHNAEWLQKPENREFLRFLEAEGEPQS